MSCKESVHEGSLTVLLELVVVLDRLYHHEKKSNQHASPFSL